MDKRLQLLIAGLVLLVAFGAAMYKWGAYSKARDLQTEILLSQIANDGLRYELQHQRIHTNQWKDKYERLKADIRTPETIYITIKSKHDEKISEHNNFTPDQHLQYFTDWFSKEDSARQRHASSLPAAAN